MIWCWDCVLKLLTIHIIIVSHARYTHIYTIRARAEHVAVCCFTNDSLMEWCLSSVDGPLPLWCLVLEARSSAVLCLERHSFGFLSLSLFFFFFFFRIWALSLSGQQVSPLLTH